MLWNIRPHLSSWILAISAIGWGNPKSFDFVGYWSRPRKAIDCPQHDWCKVFSSIGLTSQFYMGNTFLVQRQFGCCQLASMFGVLASVQCVFAWCLLSYSERPSKTWLWFEFTLHILGAFWMVCSRGWSKSWTPRRMARCLSKNSWHGGERTSWRPPMFERCKTKPEQFGLWTRDFQEDAQGRSTSPKCNSDFRHLSQLCSGLSHWLQARCVVTTSAKAWQSIVTNVRHPRTELVDSDWRCIKP